MEAIAGSSKDVLQPASSDFEIKESREQRVQDSGGSWKCFICNLEEHYDYKGSKPPFAKHLTYVEDCYIMRDPFSPLNKNRVLILGGDCSICKNSVCVECSLYYSKRFCKNCVMKNIEYFPERLQEKLIIHSDNGSDEGE